VRYRFVPQSTLAFPVWRQGTVRLPLRGRWLLRLSLLPVALTIASCGKITPGVKVSDQAVQAGSVKIAEVDSVAKGWIVVHADLGGRPGPVAGYAAVARGRNTDVAVSIDQSKGTPTLYAMLHVDRGVAGTYEFPGPDVPEQGDARAVSPAFHVTGLPPRVKVADQKIANGEVTITEVLSNGPGWLVIHADSKGAPGPVIGYGAVRDGLTVRVPVRIDARKATGTLYAMLHVDAGKAGTYEFPGPDLPVAGDPGTVSPSFKVTR
jgi:hypothetical protein